MNSFILEKVLFRLLEESMKYGWPEFDEKEFDKDGMTTYSEDREWTKQYLKSMGLIK